MIDIFLKSIAKTIYDEFKINVYINKLKQGFEEPCFFIRELNISQEYGFNNRRKRNHLISITYFPKCETIKELNYTADLLYEILENVKFGDTKRKVRAASMKHVIDDDVLVFTISYSFHIAKKTEKIYMKNLKYKGGIKNGG